MVCVWHGVYVAKVCGKGVCGGGGVCGMVVEICVGVMVVVSCWWCHGGGGVIVVVAWWCVCVCVCVCV
jgi:hypothetical protein